MKKPSNSCVGVGCIFLLDFGNDKNAWYERVGVFVELGDEIYARFEN